MKTFIKKYFHVIVIFLVVAVIIYGYIDAKINSEQLVRYPKYTIAIITSDWHHKNGRGFGVDYKYSVSGKVYDLTRDVKVKKGEKYLLIYDSVKPRNCLVLEMYPIPDSIEIPENGWQYEDVPIKIDSSKIKEHIENYK